MKKITLAILSVSLFLSFLAFHARPAFAVMRAVFPDGQSLQPLPHDSKPNISGNVNSSVTVTPEAQNESDQTPTPANDTPVPQEKTTSSFSIWWILYPLLAIGFIFLYIKLKKRETTII